MNQPLSNEALIAEIKENLRRLGSRLSSVPDNSGTVIIEAGYVSIGSIFRGNKEIKRIILPETIDYIEDAAFQDCTGLEEITLPKSIVKIGERAFQNCSSLKKIVWPEGMCKLPECVFEGCTNLDSIIISKGVICIGKSAFKGCVQLKRVTIPNTLISIATAAFEGCCSLEEIVFPSTVQILEESAFEGCKSLQEIVLPDGVWKVQNCAFKDCSRMTSVQLPKSLSWLGSNAFCNCKSLVSVSIPEPLSLISEGTFENCESLCDVIIPNTVKRIDSRAFKNCRSLQKVNFPENLERLGDESFSGCASLRRVTIPPKCYSIRSGAFQQCHNLEEVILHDNVFYIGPVAFAGCKKMQPFPIPRKLADLDATALDDIRMLADENGFVIAGKVLLYYVGEEAVVRVPENITVINYDTFNFCPQVKHVELPKGIQRVDYWHKGELFADDNGFLIIRGELCGYYGNEEFLVVPENVSDVDWGELSRNKAVKKVKLSNNFEGMLWSSAWKLLADDEGFVITGGKLCGYIGSERLINVPAGVISIDDYAFSQSPQVSQVVLPEGITSISVLCNDENWKKYADPNGLVISGSFLIKCYGVSGSLVLPDYINKIDEWAFSGNPALDEVWVPASMKPFLVRSFDVNRIKWKAK